MPLADTNPALLPDVSGLNASSLQMLEDYYTRRAQASAMRQKAKAVEMAAYNQGESSRQRDLNRAKQMEAEADIVDLQAEESHYTSRAKLLRGAREEAQTPNDPDMPAAVLAVGDRVLVRLILWSNNQSEPPKDVYEVTRVELGGMLPLGPKLGRVDVAGKTLQQAEDEVRKAAANHYRDASV